MSDTAVLVIDMLNAYRHEDAELLVPNVAEIIDPMVGLISVARERDDVDLIYVNDNYGNFTADHDDIVAVGTATASGRIWSSRSRPTRAALVPPEGPAQRLLLHARWTICLAGSKPSG